MIFEIANIESSSRFYSRRTTHRVHLFDDWSDRHWPPCARWAILHLYQSQSNIAMRFFNRTMIHPNCKTFVLFASQSIQAFSPRTAIVILGALYENLGRRAGRLHEVTVSLLLILIKNGDSQIRVEVLSTLERIVNGLGSVSGTIHREISKVARTHLCDRAMAVRIASTKVCVCTDTMSSSQDVSL